MRSINQLRHLRLFLVFVLLAALCSTALAQTAEIVYDEGTISFSYTQWPFGGFNGNYLADGPVWDQDLMFPEGQTSGCSGLYSDALSDTTTAIAVGLIDNLDGTYEAALVMVRFPDGPAPGAYPVDTTNFTSLFGYAHNVVNLTMPQPDEDLQAWLAGLQASHKFGSSSGTINVTSIGPEEFSGTFSGTLIEPELLMILTAANGQFQVSGAPVTAVPAAWVPASLAAAPNPFNPQTEVKLTLERSDQVTVAVFDLAGRRVSVLHQGQLDRGAHQWTWSGLSDAGVRQAGGVYFCRAEGQGWRLSTKLVLVP